ncbi:YdcF family protein [Sphingomonas sp. PP-F2F-G114-C0414]|uniref:YdcF family protein n=1 Tax=Sphingomonas sp. PP-F2F-G114-C0414 TaxID=2135662 RepID=UPI001C7D0C7D|nr:YdcF family protein [Sphingomonas sp. PP-F2F-G114-C0414]
MTGLRMVMAALAMTAAAPVWAETPAPVAVTDTVADGLSQRLFPMLGALGRLPGLDTRARAARIAACGGGPACVVEAAMWSDQDRAAVAAAVARLGKTGMRQNADLSVAAGVDQELETLNVVLRVYGLGLPGRYPKIDGPVFATDTPFFADSVKVAIDTARAASQARPDTIAASVRLAVALLDANDATAATRFDPLDQRENVGAHAVAARTNWSAYRYSLLIVPGVGPEDSATVLSPRSKLHALLAAQRYRQGLAPFILVSGSAVHPRGTRFVEAVEIRRALIERYGIPADRVILEPYARHTTTNLRNATRRMVALGIPLDRPTLIVTDAEQSKYIKSQTFTDRNRAELGYLPGAVGRRLSVYDLEFRPSRLSLRQDPRDPLDP